ncbi:hypothetical protein Corgl_0921 [Coriobacterium glomerans PW2]|uniref:Protein CR006 P-loop domain-containing protein n=2 Tax=Coriobacterium TaxID=33870 RepID=F2N9K3_CORGP|nr:hypothetical protein Corgl_0921 [Coriobacterium glomerans PW2]
MNSAQELKIPVSMKHLGARGLEIDLRESQMTWAPNGVGKSSIYRALKEKGPKKVSFVECSDYRANFAKSAKNKLTISARVQSISELKNQTEQLLTGCAFVDNLKSMGLTNAKTIGIAVPSHPKAKADLAGDLEQFSKADADGLIDALKGADLQFFVSHWRDLQKAKSLKEEIEPFRNEIIADAVESIERWIDEGERTCPVCGASHGRSVASIIREKHRQACQIEARTLQDYQRSHPGEDAATMAKGYDTLLKVASDAKLTSEDAVFSLCLCGGSKDNSKRIEANSTEFRKLSKRIAKFEAMRDRFYCNILKRKDELVSLLTVKFDVKEEAIKFDDVDKALTVTLPRKVDTYSTGEIDLLLILVKINDFVASDDDTLVLDDPITSFDTANQYAVIFDLIDIISSVKKTVIMFTHNSNCINIAYSQYPNCFKYESLDRWSDGLRKQPITIDDSEDSPRPLSQAALIEQVGRMGCKTYNTKIKYLKAVAERESVPGLNAVFHYDAPLCSVDYEKEKLCNEYLAKLIESFEPDSLNKSSFACRCLDKELLMIALRVWVEKQLYEDQLNESCSPDLFGKAKTLGTRIEAIFPKDGPSSWHGPDTVTRAYLMGKRVMLNQSSHSGAQPVPFEYALNLSAYEIDKMVQDIKAHFGE